MKKKIIFAVSIICLCTVAFLGIKNVNAKTKIKYDMTYGLTIQSKHSKNKEIKLKNGTNVLTVIPNYLDNFITCTVVDDNGIVLDKDNHVHKCEFLSKKDNNITIYIQNCMSNEIVVELHHQVN